MQAVLLGIGSRVKHPAYDKGVVIRLHQEAYEVCFLTYGIKMVGKQYQDWEIIEAVPTQESVSLTTLEKSIKKVLSQYDLLPNEVELGHKWLDGQLILQPGEAGMKGKEMPIDTFFHKIVMVRDRLRVLEQRVNSSNLSDEEKVNLQQYITRIYGSLTSFNVLFKDKEDHFQGEKSR